jgi:two-component SAPR family response regulator
MHAEAANDPSRKHRSSSEGPFPVRMRLLGGFGIWVGSRAVSERAWHLRKSKSLVKLLALAPGHTLHREQIMDLLWPELGKRAASNNLRGSLHGARRALAADSIVASHYLASKEERVALCPEVELWVDVEAFEEAAKAARRSGDPGASPRSRFVGRERDLKEVKRALAMTRLLTLTGAGGSGSPREPSSWLRH